jgi:hypothetical protein
MQIYEAVRKVPESAKKSFNNGSFSGTDINPMWRIKVLTEQFGPCGAGWYYEVLSERYETHHDTTMAIVDLNLYWNVTGDLANPTWSKPVFGTGGNKLVATTKSGQRASDEGYKMALTDALSVACKALGIGADVYFERDTSSKYSEYYGAQAAQQKPMTVAHKPTSAMLTVLANKTNDEQKAKLKETYGANLEKLDYETCDRLLKKLGGQA